MREIADIKADIRYCEKQLDILTLDRQRREMTVHLEFVEKELVEVITTGIPLEKLEVYCNAIREGRLHISPTHKVKDGTAAWTIDHYGKQQQGKIIYCTDGYAMKFICKTCGFRIWNEDIGQKVFLTNAEAEQKLKELEIKNE